jgi:hypothetical protein
MRFPEGAVACRHEGLAAKAENPLLHGQPLHLRLGGGEEGEAACTGGPLLFECKFQGTKSVHGSIETLNAARLELIAGGPAWKFTKAGCQCSAERSLKDK